jgi:hypothetical protein
MKVLEGSPAANLGNRELFDPEDLLEDLLPSRDWNRRGLKESLENLLEHLKVECLLPGVYLSVHVGNSVG